MATWASKLAFCFDDWGRAKGTPLRWHPRRRRVHSRCCHRMPWDLRLAPLAAVACQGSHWWPGPRTWAISTVPWVLEARREVAKTGWLAGWLADWLVGDVVNPMQLSSTKSLFTHFCCWRMFNTSLRCPWVQGQDSGVPWPTIRTPTHVEVLPWRIAGSTCPWISSLPCARNSRSCRMLVLLKPCTDGLFFLGGQCLCSVRKPVFVFHCFFLEANVFTNDGKQRHMDYSFLFCHIPGIQWGVANRASIELIANCSPICRALLPWIWLELPVRYALES